MNAAKLINLAPMLIMVTFLAYAGYSIHESAADPAANQSDLAKDLEIMLEGIVDAGAATARRLASEELRNPFQVAAKPASEATKSKDTAAPEGQPDPVAEFVRGLSLDATLIQGRDQIAIINGRMYRRGQHLVIGDKAGNSDSKLFLAVVQHHRVFLRGESKTYELGYPEKFVGRKDETKKAATPMSSDAAMAEIDPEGELAFYKKLLSSPLGKMGAGILGKQAPPGARPPRARGASPGGP